MERKINIPICASYILDKLNDNNYEAYIVGGAVRNSLLKIPVKDWDITTNAKAEEVMKIFKSLNKQVIETGLKHGTVTVMSDNIPIEVTTFRIDGEYSDGRHPDKVTFTSNLKEDLSRRDFTINALAYNNKDGLIDCFGGTQDLQNKIIRAVGNPSKRFNEDGLRMLRAVRFSAQLGFDIEEETRLAIENNHILIKKISKERVQEEINKILISDNSEYIFKLHEYGLLQDIIPELADCFQCPQDNPYHIYNVGEHIIKSLKHIDKVLHLKLAMLFHDIGKPLCKTSDENGVGHFYGHGELSKVMVVNILKELRYDNNTISKVSDLVFYHDGEIADTKKSVKKWLNKVGEDIFRDLLKVKEADIMAQNPIFYDKRHDKLQRVNLVLEDVINSKECFDKKTLALDGNDLIQLGFKQGKAIGIIIDKLVELVLDNPELNSKEGLLGMVKENVNIKKLNI